MRRMKKYATERKGKQAKKYLNVVCTVSGNTASYSDSCSVSHAFATPWTVACQAPLSMEFSRQGYWSGLPLEW